MAIKSIKITNTDGTVEDFDLEVTETPVETIAVPLNTEIKIVAR